MKLPTTITGRAVRALVMKRGGAHGPPQVLLLRPTNPAKGTLLELPGGKVEPGENWLPALRREVWEETGIGQLDLLHMPPYVVLEPEPDQPDHAVLKVVLHAKLPKGASVPSTAPDGQGVGFYPLDAATLAQARPGVVRWLNALASSHQLPGQHGRGSKATPWHRQVAAQEALIERAVAAYLPYVPLALRAPLGWQPYRQLG